MTATPYHRELEWNEPPACSERAYAGWSVVRAAGTPAATWRPLARVADVELFLAPAGRAADAPTLFVEPLLARKRGARGSGDYAGVDGRVRLVEAWPDVAAPGVDPIVVSPELPAVSSPAPGRRRAPEVRVAIVDVSFANREVLEGFGRADRRAEGPYLVGLAEAGSPHAPAPARPGAASGHGTVMAAVVLAKCPAARVGLFAVPSEAGAARPYLAATDLAVAIAVAVERWRADVVLVAMSDGAWGTPRHLREVLRAAARSGRGGRGAAIVCSVGDPSRNHARADDSAALGADDLASQPWVMAVAACDRWGRWYRVFPRYGRGAGAAYNRLGPAVAFAALGEPRRYRGRVAADDSSQASALVAGAAARVLRSAPELTAGELRAILALTARSPAVVDDSRGLAGGALDGRDREGHSVKVGFGVVNPGAACLAARDPLCLAMFATRFVPDGPAGADRSGSALALARSWRRALRGRAASTDPRERALARAYLRVAPALARLYLRALPVQESLGWLARHLRTLAASPSGNVPLGDWRGQDHGALVERVRHTVDTLRDALATGDPRQAAWLARFDAALAADPAGRGVESLVADVVTGHFQSAWAGCLGNRIRACYEGAQAVALLCRERTKGAEALGPRSRGGRGSQLSAPASLSPP